jgi:hypothetical protein
MLFWGLFFWILLFGLLPCSVCCKDAAQVVGLSHVSGQMAAQLHEKEPDAAARVMRRRMGHFLVEPVQFELTQDGLHGRLGVANGGDQ